MKNFIFVLGGARSGKSQYAIKLAKRIGRRVAYVATCNPLDDEMRKRAKVHKASRPRAWKTIEESRDVKKAIAHLGDRYDVAIIDCLTLLVSNLLLDGLSRSSIKRRMEELAKHIKKIDSTIIAVSNEVGLGIVPGERLSREFRDIAGITNQIMARYADEVYMLTAGIPMRIK